MATFKKIHLADINPDRLTEELTAAVSVPFEEGYHGFDRVNPRLIAPASGRKVVSTNKNALDFAEIGEIRFRTSEVFSAADDAAINSTLAAHDATLLTVEQSREDKDAAALAPTASSLQVAAWNALAPPAKQELLRRCCQLLFRGKEFADLDTDD